MATTDGTLARFRQPEYTGENRCTPCTVVNVLIALAVTGAIVAGASLAGMPMIGAAAGAGFFVLSLLSIYLRGYLVPGTPELTKQYFPPWLLSLFGKEPVAETQATTESEINPENVLISAGALEECEDRDDLCLTDSFREEWYDEIDAVRSENAEREELLKLLDIDEGAVQFNEFGPAFEAKINGRRVGQWESEGAYYADLGAARTLARNYEDWDERSLGEKSQLLNGLRLFIDTCPECGGVPEFGSETVESCCSTYEVAAVSCRDCEARLFESKVNA